MTVDLVTGHIGDLVMDNPMLTAALSAVARGWYVFPARRNDKLPALHHTDQCPGTGACRDGHRTPEQRAMSNPDHVRWYWNSERFNGCNVAIACGPSRLVVLDLDTAKPGKQPPPRWDQPGIMCGLDVLAVLCEEAGEPLPLDTYTVTTPSGGLHLYFTAPDGVELRNTAGDRGRGLGWLVDTRAGGGYVLAAESRVDGCSYVLVEDAVVAPLPLWLCTRLAYTPRPPREAVSVDLSATRAGRYVEAAMRKEVEKVLTAQEGTRNHTLFAATVALGQLVAGGALAEGVARTALEHAGLTVGLTRWEVGNTIDSGLKAGAERPRRVDAA